MPWYWPSNLTIRSRPVKRPRHAHGVHGGLGARGGQAGHLAEGQLGDQLAGADLVLAGEAEADAQAHALVDVVVHARVGVAEDDRPVAHAQVDELVAVDVPDAAALAAIDVDRVLTPGTEVGVRAARAGPAWHAGRAPADVLGRGRRERASGSSWLQARNRASGTRIAAEQRLRCESRTGSRPIVRDARSRSPFPGRRGEAGRAAAPTPAVSSAAWTRRRRSGLEERELLALRLDLRDRGPGRGPGGPGRRPPGPPGRAGVRP